MPHLPHIPYPGHPKRRFDLFFMLTGVTFAAFAAGFGVCLFDLETIDACVEVAESWVDILRKVGDHIIAWFIALCQAVFDRPHVPV